MAVLINRDTAVMVQGISGKQGSLHTGFMLDYGVNVAAGVAPGKHGGTVHGVPVYQSIAEAIKTNKIDASLIMVPPRAALGAVTEAITNSIPLVVVITEHIPIHDTLKFKWLARESGVTLVGPNTIGLISPGKCKIGVMPGPLYSEGGVGVISRSGTMTHEIASGLSWNNIGQSTCLGIGGDPVIGIGFEEALELFLADEETKVVILIGEIGGSREEEAAAYIKRVRYPKPLFALVCGRNAPVGRKMGHAGALINENSGTYQSKTAALQEAGVAVKDTVKELIESVSACYRQLV